MRENESKTKRLHLFLPASAQKLHHASITILFYPLGFYCSLYFGRLKCHWKLQQCSLLLKWPFQHKASVASALAGMFPFTGMEGERDKDRETLAEKGEIGRGRKESVKERKDQGWNERQMEAGCRAGIGNHVQGSAKNMQLFNLTQDFAGQF